jgi:hypothetical protein
MTTMISAAPSNTRYASRLLRHGHRPSTESGDYLSIDHTRTASFASSNQSTAETLVWSKAVRSCVTLEGGEAFERDLGIHTTQLIIHLYQDHRERPDQTTRRLVMELPSPADVSTQLSTCMSPFMLI